MKGMFRVLLVTLVALATIGGTGFAYQITYNDNYANWPGWFVDARDVIGTPSITAMTVTIDDDSGLLTKVELAMTDRRVWDALFINSNWTGQFGDYQSWDYYVYSPNSYTATPYKVSGSFDPQNDYLLASNPGGMSGRWGHPAGIDPEYLNQLNSVGLSYSSNILTYDFGNAGIELGENFVIGYSPWCANDVFLTPVPEPSVLLLMGLGLGMLGAYGFIGRRRNR